MAAQLVALDGFGTRRRVTGKGLRQVLPGSHMLVGFAGDGHLHERIFLWPVSLEAGREKWIILSADDDQYVENREDWNLVRDMLTEGYPRGDGRHLF